MAIYYVDLVSGNDSTGDGSASAPFKTYTKARDMEGFPHDIRIAKTGAHTTVTGDCTFTYDSTTVNTASDLRASISIGDYIGKTTAQGHGAKETFYRVNGISATSITLEDRYHNDTETVASILKLTYVNTGTNHCFPNTKDGETLSGGWNLTTETRDGETWVTNVATRTTGSRYGIYIDATADVSYLNFVEVSCGAIGHNSNAKEALLSYCSFCGCGGGNLHTVYCYFSVDHCFASVFKKNYAAFLGSRDDISITNCIASTQGGTAKNYGIVVNIGANITVEDCQVYCARYGTISRPWQKLVRCDFYNCQSAIYTSTSYSDDQNSGEFIDCKFINCTKALENNSAHGGQYFKGCEFTNCSTALNIARSTILDGCSFDNCNYCIGVNREPIRLYNCSFTNIGVAGIFLTDVRFPITNCIINNCTADAPSTGKILYPLSDTYCRTLPDFVITNSFGITGTYYGWGSTITDSTVYRTIGPSWKMTTVSSISRLGDFKIFSTFVNSGDAKKISVYIKKDPTWTGSILPKIKLNGTIIKEETIITTLTTDWVLYEINITADLITSDGELSLEYQPYNFNNNNIYLDDITIEDL